MISIEFKNIDFEKIEEILSLAKKTYENIPDHAENGSNKDVEAIIENYLLSCNDNKAALEKCIANLTKQQMIELLAIYYFFAKLTYDTTIPSDEELYALWELCCLNSNKDIDRLGLTTMMEFLKEKHNLGVVLSTAVLNLKNN